MAIIEDQALTPPDLPTSYKRRVVIKFLPNVETPTTIDSRTIKRVVGQAWEGLEQAFPGIKLERYFSTLDEPALASLSQRAANVGQGAVSANFNLYYAIECPDGVKSDDLVNTVSAWPNVETAYVEGGPVPPPLNPADDPRSTNQGYLDAASGGIDARWAWDECDGSGIGFVDLERGWTLDHGDLAAANINVISGLSQDFHGHGTAVLGEVVAVDNNIGGIGIAPGASARVVSQWRTAANYNTAEAILSAVGTMAAGDVLLLEAQTSYPTATGYVPVEVELAVFDAIQFATSQGITVVEAGANGSVDLDAFQGSGALTATVG